MKVPEIDAARADVARRAAAEAFRRARNRAFRGIVTHRQAVRLYPVTRLEATRERLVAGQMAKMDQTARRLAARAEKGLPT